MISLGGEQLEYEIKYAKRRTLTISVRDGKLFVIAPTGTKPSVIEELITKHKRWIEGKIASQKRQSEKLSRLDEREITEMKKAAKAYFAATVSRYAALMGAEYGKIRITSAMRRFGSCSSDKNLSFSYRLMLYPEAAREYVAVHELAHTFEMNHSKKFYAIIEKTLPDYKERKKLLK